MFWIHVPWYQEIIVKVQIHSNKNLQDILFAYSSVFANFS